MHVSSLCQLATIGMAFYAVAAVAVPVAWPVVDGIDEAVDITERALEVPDDYNPKTLNDAVVTPSEPTYIQGDTDEEVQQAYIHKRRSIEDDVGDFLRKGISVDGTITGSGSVSDKGGKIQGDIEGSVDGGKLGKVKGELKGSGSLNSKGGNVKGEVKGSVNGGKGGGRKKGDTNKGGSGNKGGNKGGNKSGNKSGNKGGKKNG